MPSRNGGARTACAAVAATSVLLAFAATLPRPAAAEEQQTFRVCADPNNMPFSNEAKEGLENKLAELFASELGEPVTYTWHAQRRGFIRQTLKADACDVIMGVPKQLDMVATTQPYYRSGYVFVSRTDRNLDIHSIKDARLRPLKIGVQLIGDDGFNTPPAHALAAQGMIDNVVGFTVYGDYRHPNPPADIVKAVAEGKVDIAAVWGPLAGYFAKHSNVPLRTELITDTDSFAPLIFQYDIALGVRKGDTERKTRLDRILKQKRPQISALLEQFGFPLAGQSEHLTQRALSEPDKQ